MQIKNIYFQDRWAEFHESLFLTLILTYLYVISPQDLLSDWSWGEKLN